MLSQLFSKSRLTSLAMVRESSSLSSRATSVTPSTSTSGTLTPATQEGTPQPSIISATTATHIANMVELGTIRVDVHHVTVGKEVSFDAVSAADSVSARNKKLAAKLNALSHFVRYV